MSTVTRITVEKVFARAFDATRSPRSAEYKAGARAVLEYRIDGTALPPRPYAAGTAASDAYYAGVAEGHALWRAAIENGGDA